MTSRATAPTSLFIAGEAVTGTAYFQKVCSTSPPWYWGVLHLEDGSYMDWFLPPLPHHDRTNTGPWKKGDIRHIGLSRGLFHDATHRRTERFARGPLKIGLSANRGGTRQQPGAPLPVFDVHMWNGRTSIKLTVEAVERHTGILTILCAMRMVALTYNEYPLSLTGLKSLTNSVFESADYGWARGNAEHAWGVLH